MLEAAEVVGLASIVAGVWLAFGLATGLMAGGALTIGACVFLELSPILFRARKK